MLGVKGAQMSMSDADSPPAPTGPPGARGAAPPAIILARHGRPALDRSKSMGWRAYKTWWAAYDEGGLAEGEAPPEDLLNEAREAAVVLSSPLTRSVETARAVAEGRPVVTDPVFVEAPLPPPPIPGLKLKPGQWGVFARIAWWLGYSGGMESRRAAERRAEAAVERILAEALPAESRPRTVIVCAHGWFNRMMRPALLARGWRCVCDGRDHYWSYRRYERP